MNFMCHAHKYESGDADVEDRVSRHQDQDTHGVSSQPDVILRDEQLQRKEMTLTSSNFET